MKQVLPMAADRFPGFSIRTTSSVFQLYAPGLEVFTSDKPIRKNQLRAFFRRRSGGGRDSIDLLLADGQRLNNRATVSKNSSRLFADGGNSRTLPKKTAQPL